VTGWSLPVQKKKGWDWVGERRGPKKKIRVELITGGMRKKGGGLLQALLFKKGIMVWQT